MATSRETIPTRPATDRFGLKRAYTVAIGVTGSGLTGTKMWLCGSFAVGYLQETRTGAVKVATPSIAIGKPGAEQLKENIPERPSQLASLLGLPRKAQDIPAVSAAFRERCRR